MNTEEMPRYMNLGQACIYLNIKSRNTLKKYINNGLRVSVIAGSKRIDKVDADSFMQSHKQ